MTINCIIIEDERPALELMEDNVSKIPWLNLVGTCKSTFEANELLMKEKVDLIFSDVEMPIVSGIQFLKTNFPLQTPHHPTPSSPFPLDYLQLFLLPLPSTRTPHGKCIS